jgi:integrase
MAAMGRRRSTNHGLPPHMAQKGRQLYYVTTTAPRRWIPLGSDYPKALIKWAELEGEPVPACARLFKQIAEIYRANVVPTKALRTQRDNRRRVEQPYRGFGESDFETIAPVDVATYRKNRYSKKKLKEGEKPKLAKTRGNREIALLSDLWNWARDEGYTSAPNPCAGVDRNKEHGRDRYAHDAEFDAIYAEADEELQDAMDLLLFTAQRPSDVIKMKRTEIRDGALPVKQGKTGHKERIEISGDFKVAIDRMLSRPRAATGVYLVQDRNGQPLTYWTLEDRFAKARAAAAIKMPSVADIQMRDFRGKAATDVEDLAHAQRLLGHSTRAMTERYVKQRAGERVAPLTRKRKGAGV